MLNLGVPQPWADEGSEGTNLQKNSYFDALAEEGYGIRVYQSSYITYCDHSAVAICNEFRIADLEPIADSAMPIGDKASTIVHGFLSLSGVALTVTSYYDRAAAYSGIWGLEWPVVDLRNRSLTIPVGALTAFDALVSDLRQAQPGEAYFAHLLLPHYPYALNSDCSIRPVSEWKPRKSAVGGLEERQVAYAEQVRCAMAKVDEALTALAEAPGGDRFIAIIHGDHGSRITQYDPTSEALGQFTDEDVIASYSTLFAVRAEGIEDGIEHSRVPAAEILKSLATSEFASASVTLPADFVHSVMLGYRSSEPAHSYPLPEAWTDQ